PMRPPASSPSRAARSKSPGRSRRESSSLKAPPPILGMLRVESNVAIGERDERSAIYAGLHDETPRQLLPIGAPRQYCRNRRRRGGRSGGQGRRRQRHPLA